MTNRGGLSFLSASSQLAVDQKPPPQDHGEQQAGKRANVRPAEPDPARDQNRERYGYFDDGAARHVISIGRRSVPLNSRAVAAIGPLTMQLGRHDVLDPGLERANLRALLGGRCISAAAQDLDYIRRVGGQARGDDLLDAQVFLQSECEALVEVADELERMMAGGEV